MELPIIPERKESNGEIKIMPLAGMEALSLPPVSEINALPDYQPSIWERLSSYFPISVSYEGDR